ncbi:Disease resistance protein [Corchorus capsularis]|uniref:Disease resistance protein n=1 Tax=Corchorus capsularis TaxID=210143 RepID=A0A1R3KXV8_COCAP|nr:Disease resistance protein [Corchorus capsularis]
MLGVRGSTLISFNDQGLISEEELTIAKAIKETYSEVLTRKGEEAKHVVLTGKPGTGKTWLAQELVKYSVSEEGSFYMSLWISLNHDDDSIHQSIARQLSIPTRADVWEDDDPVSDNDKKVDRYPYVDTKIWESRPDPKETDLKQKVVQKLAEKIKKMQSSKQTFLLLVLDSDERVVKNGECSYNYNNIMDKLFDLGTDLQKYIGNNAEFFSVKVLITAREVERHMSTDKSRVVKVKPLSGEEAEKFLKERLRNDPKKFDKFNYGAIKNRKEVLPIQIIMLAEALNRIQQQGSEALERALDAANNILQHAREDDPIPFLHFIYENLPKDDDCMIDCFWHCWKFLGNHGSVHYNELITHWMLEGHLDLSVGLKNAYDKGYNIMMKLIDHGMLKMQGGNLIGFEGATLQLIKPESNVTLEDLSDRGLFHTSKLGLANVLEGDSGKVFKRMAPIEGMMKTVRVHEEPISSLLIDGSRLCREVPQKFFQSMQNLQVLSLFQPRLKSLPKSISEMENLVVLVLRDCSLLNDVKGIEKLKKLIVLEISGAPFLKEIEEVVFENLSELRIINLSALGIESLPPSLSSLTQVRRLILRDCSSLKALPKLANFKELEVIDLSGSSSLGKIQEKCFKSFTKLQVINFSGTKLEKLPIVQTLEHLRLLLVKGCDQLSGLRFMKHLKSLKVLDVSGCTRIKEIYFDCFDEVTQYLRILDLSETEIRFLPDYLGKHLCELRLKNCHKLQRLPSTKDLKDLEFLDLSNCSTLQNFPEGFFENLTILHSLNLSNTKVEIPQSISQLQNLHRLFLKHCQFKTLPEFNKFTSLIELDLSNCDKLESLPSLKDNELLEIINLSSCKLLSKLDESFQHMSRLQELNLSDTQISCLPSLPAKPSKLRSLILHNCIKLEKPPEFGTLTRLEQLDLRGTTSLKSEDIKVESLNHLTQLQTLKLSKIPKDMKFSELTGLHKALHVLDLSGEKEVESLSSLDGFTNLRELLLGGCSSLTRLESLESLSNLEVLDLSGTKLENVREKILELTQLKRLHLPEKAIEELKPNPEKETEEMNQGNVNFPPLELKFDRCCISKPSEIPEEDKKPSEIPEKDKKPSQVVLMHGTEIFESLKKDPALLDRIKQSTWIVSPAHSSKTQGQSEDNYGDSRRLIFGEIYSKIRKLPAATDGQFLEIQGFDEFPKDIEVVLERAKYIMLVENQFLKNLSDLQSSSLKNMKGCWLERCTEMERIFAKADVEIGENLEILWISNLPKLNSLCNADLPSMSFANLKQLYIDCCPTLETVFSLSQLPEKLEILQIMFCDKLKTLFGAKDSVTSEVQATSSTSKEAQTPSSSKSLPKKETSAGKEETAKPTSSNKNSPKKETSTGKEESADKKVQATTPADKKEETSKGLPKKEASSAGKEVQAKALTSKEESADKKVQATTPTDKKMQTISSTNLKFLHISYCPMLETVFSSAQLPKTLESLQIKFCGKLKSLSDQNLINSELPNLHTLHLLELPGWTAPSIEPIFNKSILKDVKVSPNIPGGKILMLKNASTGADQN